MRFDLRVTPEGMASSWFAMLPRSTDGDDKLTKWVDPTVNVLYAFSATVGQGVGVVRIGTFCRGEFPL